MNDVQDPVPSILLSELADQFDVFFVDQFGVLHNGEQVYEGAVDALRKLRLAGKQVVLIGNSGKRSSVNERRLKKLGFDENCYNHFISSGEVGWRLLSNMRFSSSDSATVRCLLVSRDEDTSAIDGLGFQLVDDSASADVVVLSGCRDDILHMDYYIELLSAAARRKTPCVCTSPDKIVLTANGPKFGPGAIAETYRSLGGTVRWIGKPHAEIYQQALTVLVKDINDDATQVLPRIVCIGDSIEHDIAGGAAAGHQTVLVRTGILAQLSPAELQDLYQRYAARPDYLLAKFQW